MRKSIKRALTLIMVFALVAGICACGDSSETSRGDSRETDNGGPPSGVVQGSSETLRVYNASTYIDETTIADFEREFAIKVVYDEFESNEELYDTIANNPYAYDVLVPSDYTIDRLIKEDMLAKIDSNNVPNMRYIAPQYLSPEYDADNEYVVPYMVGTLGILYNKKLVSGSIDSWESLWDSQYKGKILMWDSMRDVIGPTLKMLGYSMNTNDDTELEQARERLIAQRSLVQAYAGDIIRDIMIADEGALALIYSGEAKIAVDQNPNLIYVIPKEGANKWVDGFVIMKTSEHKEAAEQFINFMCRPNIAVRNMTKTGYTSPVFGAWDEFGDNLIMFPTEEELDRCEAFLYDKDATYKYDMVWREIRS